MRYAYAINKINKQEKRIIIMSCGISDASHWPNASICSDDAIKTINFVLEIQKKKSCWLLMPDAFLCA